MKAIACFLLACLAALPAVASRQFPVPSLAATVAEASGEAIAASSTKAFAANSASNRVAVVDEAGRVTSVAVGPQPRYIVALGFGFMTSNAGDGSVSLSRDLVTSTSLSVGGSGPMVVDSSGRVYLLRPDGFVVIIDSA